MTEHYLDNSATTRVFPEVAELMNRIYLEEYGNPSSMHHKGVEAENERSEEHTSELQSRMTSHLVCRLLLEIGRASCRERV